MANRKQGKTLQIEYYYSFFNAIPLMKATNQYGKRTVSRCSNEHSLTPWQFIIFLNRHNVMISTVFVMKKKIPWSIIAEDPLAVSGRLSCILLFNCGIFIGGACSVGAISQFQTQIYDLLSNFTDQPIYTCM